MVDRIVDPSIAIKAYGSAQNAAGKGVSGEDGISFSDFLRQTAEESVKTLKTGEKASAQAVTGEADLTDVVQAVTAAELTLQTVVAVRDRLVGAYQEIMRMPV